MYPGAGLWGRQGRKSTSRAISYSHLVVAQDASVNECPIASETQADVARLSTDRRRPRRDRSTRGNARDDGRKQGTKSTGWIHRHTHRARMISEANRKRRHANGKGMRSVSPRLRCLMVSEHKKICAPRRTWQLKTASLVSSPSSLRKTRVGRLDEATSQ